MDISSTTTSAAAATAEVSTTTSSRTREKSDSSFKDEMQKVSESENTEKTDKTENSDKSEKETDNKTHAEAGKTDEKSDDKNDFKTDQNKVLQGSIITNQQINNQNLQNNNNVQALMDANARLIDIAGLSGRISETKVDYSGINMSADDAKFFSDLVQNTDKTLQGVMDDLKSGVEQNVQKTTQHVKVSATLMDALNNAVKSNQPVRINLDKDVSVIIKVDKDGALSATFIPGDKAVEEYLRQNISTLRQRFDEQELSYRDLSYSRQKQNQNRRNNNKEKDNE